MTSEEKAEALLPCPFCGGEAREWPATYDYTTVGCAAGTHNCSVQPSVHTHRPDALAAWNTRPSPKPEDKAAVEREEVARVVDPVAWRRLDRNVHGYAGHVTHELRVAWVPELQDSLTKADAILALLRGGSPDGWKLVPTKATDRMLEQAAFNLCAEFGVETIKPLGKIVAAAYEELVSAATSPNPQEVG